jgi:hypothetical protein
MTRWPARVAAQIAAMTLVLAIVAVLADRPLYYQIPPHAAVLKLSFTHGSDRRSECRTRTPEELAKLPPNMRKPLECPRTRGSVYVELDVDGQTIYRASLRPSGLSGDGPSRVYQRFVMPAGPHIVAVRMRDTPRLEGFDHAKSGEIVLAAGDNFVVDFQAGGFVFR